MSKQGNTKPQPKVTETDWQAVAKAWKDDAQAVGQAARFEDAAILSRVGYGRALLALDDAHGYRLDGSESANKQAATDANAAFAERMALVLGDGFVWDRAAKVRASQARNIVRGAESLKAAGVNVDNDAKALKAVASLAVKAGPKVKDAGPAVAQILADMPAEKRDVVKAIRAYVKSLSPATAKDDSAEGTGIAALIDALTAAVSLSKSRDEWADAASDDERAALAALMETWAKQAASLKAWANA